MVVVFDLDDTLYPEMDYVRSAYRAIARRFGNELLPVMLAATSPRDAFDSTGIGIDKVLEVYRLHKPDIVLPWQSRYVLESLRLAGCKMGLVTDGRSVTQRHKVEALGLSRFVDSELIMISEEVGSEKISGEAFRRIMNTTDGVGPYLYVGDNPAKDFYAPNMLGWLTVEVERGGAGENIFPQDIVSDEMAYSPKIVIENISELLDVVKR